MIYLTFFAGIGTESLAFFLKKKLRNYPTILGQIWIKQHKIIINIITNFLYFWLGHCKYVGTFFFNIKESILLTEITVIYIKKNIISRTIKK